MSTIVKKNKDELSLIKVKRMARDRKQPPHLSSITKRQTATRRMLKNTNSGGSKLTLK